MSSRREHRVFRLVSQESRKTELSQGTKRVENVSRKAQGISHDLDSGSCFCWVRLFFRFQVVLSEVLDFSIFSKGFIVKVIGLACQRSHMPQK